MAGFEIERANFEKKKNELKKFAEQKATNTELSGVETDGQWSDFWSGGIPGWLSGHKVTGDELNSLVTKLQNCFVEVNERERKVVKEFGQVYETFEALDKGYIQGILISVKSAEKASSEAKAAQKDIDDTINALQITVDKLKNFKEEINGYSHLEDIDEIWTDVQRFDKSLRELSNKSKEQNKNLSAKVSDLLKFKKNIDTKQHIQDIDVMWGDITAITEKIDSVSNGINELASELKEQIYDIYSFKNDIESINHLSDIGAIWQDVEDLKQSVLQLPKTVEEKEKSILQTVAGIQEMINRQSHFTSIDDMWGQVEQNQKSIKECENEINRLQEFENVYNDLKDMKHIKDIDEEWELAQALSSKVKVTEERLSDAENVIDELSDKYEKCVDENKLLSRKNKIAYAVAGCALGLTVLQLFLILAGVL